jgi:hypothetical protein
MPTSSVRSLSRDKAMRDLAELDLAPLPCSICQPLGDYYQDFRPILGIVESGHHGELDRMGVPRVLYPSQGLFYNATTISQYALANASAAIRGDAERKSRLRVLCDWLVQEQQTQGDGTGLWLMAFDNPKYSWLRAPWSSALAQGQAVSALLRGAELLDDRGYSDAACSAYEALHGRRTSLSLVDETGPELWYEEYPAVRPLHVLNGHVYALLGVLDFARAFDDEVAHARWRRAVTTLSARLGEYDLGYWSAYDLLTKEPVDHHYHKNIHIPQLRILHGLGGGAAFAACADRWEAYMDNRLARTRRAVSVRLRGIRRRISRVWS